MSQVACMPMSAVWPRAPFGFSEWSTMLRAGIGDTRPKDDDTLRVGDVVVLEVSGFESVTSARRWLRS
jgi:hypothetical protein